MQPKFQFIMFKKFLLASLLFIPLQPLFAQTEHIFGKIVDQDNGEQLLGVTIVYKSAPTFGTITNVNGEFALKKIDMGDSLVISHLGYHTETVPVSAVLQDIKLRKQTYRIASITVYPIESIIEKAWRRYYSIYKQEEDQNARTKRQNRATFFYRQTTRSGTIYNEFIEAFMSANNSYGISDLRLQKGRYGLLQKEEGEPISFTNFFSFSQIRPFHQKIPPVHVVNVFLQPNSMQLYEITVTGVIENGNGDEILTINFMPKSDIGKRNIMSGQLYLRLRDYSVLKVNASYNLEMSTSKGKIETDSYVSEISYIEGIKDYPVVGSVVNTLKGRATINELTEPFEINSTMLYVDYSLPSARRGSRIYNEDILLREIMRQNYDPEFWRENPIIKRTPVEESVIKWFEENEVFGNFNPYE
jgi:hypothetical protein